MNSSARVLTTLVILLVLGGAAHAQYVGPTLPAPDPLSPPPPNGGANPYGRYGNPYSPDSINNPNGVRNFVNPNSPYNQNSPYNPNVTGTGRR